MQSQMLIIQLESGDRQYLKIRLGFLSPQIAGIYQAYLERNWNAQIVPLLKATEQHA